MKIKTTRFGTVEVSKDSIVNMPDGMLGFPACTRYVLLHDRTDTPFKWLQAVDDPAVAFIVINPTDFFPDYEIVLNDDQVASLDLKEATEAIMLTTVTVDRENGKITTNLLGPIVINARTLHARQIVLDDERYGTKHVIGEIPKEEHSNCLAKAA